MEINEPDKGVFKGFGNLEAKRFANRKYFPNIRNINQFQYTHNHKNDYKTSFQSFRQFDKVDYRYNKVKSNANQSQIQLGNNKKAQYQSESKGHFRKYNFSLPPKPIIKPEEGIGINEYSQRTGEKVGFSSTSRQCYNPFRKVADNQNVKYRYSRTDRFNPITGQFKANATFGFEDFIPSTNKNYKANNYTVVPAKGEKFDIISGRKLTYF